jgi:hypothetical protein
MDLFVKSILTQRIMYVLVLTGYLRHQSNGAIENSIDSYPRICSVISISKNIARYRNIAIS